MSTPTRTITGKPRINNIAPIYFTPKQARLIMGWSQSHAAKSIQISLRRWQYIESGEREAKFLELCALTWVVLTRAPQFRYDQKKRAEQLIKHIPKNPELDFRYTSKLKESPFI